jgi:hypothetical protein
MVTQMKTNPRGRQALRPLLSAWLSRNASKGPAEAPASKPRLRSSIDETTPAFIRGWAFDPTSADPVVIELRAEGGAVLTCGMANQPRPDVGRELGTDGLQGFWIPLPEGASGRARIEVFACSTSGETRLTVLELDDESEFPAPGHIDIGEAMIVVRREALTRALGDETLVICGPARGGTSIVAYALLCTGYYLGEKLGKDNHEDQEIVNLIGDPTAMEGIIVERNRRFRRWGFKLPDAVHHVDWLARALRNPVFLVVFRNPVATTKSILKRDPIFGGGLGFRKLATAFAHGLNDMQLGLHVLRTSAPAILLDVDAARGAPERLVREFANLFAPNATDQLIKTIAREISLASYKPNPGARPNETHGKQETS